MKVILEIDDSYGALVIAAIGSSLNTTKVSAHAIALSDCNYLTIGSDGIWIDSWEEEDG